MLYDNSFVAEPVETEEEPENPGGAIFVPKETFTDTGIDNLKKLVRVKGNLIKKALGIANAELTDSGEYIGFPWISEEISPDDVPAVTQFINALCDMARKQKRITASEKEVDNKKYAFRCFLLRLGFIGDEYKGTRKILLRNLDGKSYSKS